MPVLFHQEKNKKVNLGSGLKERLFVFGYTYIFLLGNFCLMNKELKYSADYLKKYESRFFNASYLCYNHKR